MILVCYDMRYLNIFREFKIVCDSIVAIELPCWHSNIMISYYI